MTEPTHRTRVLLDTSAVIDMPSAAELPPRSAIAISSITLAELSAGVHAAKKVRERAVRLARLQRVEATVHSLPFTPGAARMYDQFYAMVLEAGRNPRPRRMDLLIAAVAAINRLPLVTRNGADFSDLEPLLKVISLSAAPAT